jgi:putative transcriptional regulator
MDAKKLGAKIREKGMTQAELGRAAGCEQQMIGHILSGRKDPSLKLAVAIARALGCKVDDLVIDPVEVA